MCNSSAHTRPEGLACFSVSGGRAGRAVHDAATVWWQMGLQRSYVDAGVFCNAAGTLQHIDLMYVGLEGRHMLHACGLVRLPWSIAK